MEKKNLSKIHPIQMYRLNEKCVGYAEKIDNCWNYSIYVMSQTFAILNEYTAGYIQGKLQGQEMIKASRDNTWKNLYLCDTNHTYPTSIPPTKEDLEKTERILKDNHSFLNEWVAKAGNRKVSEGILRLQMRMLGIYEGAMNFPEPEIYELTDKEKAVASLLARINNLWEQPLGYGDAPLSIVDVYFINAQMDVADIIANSRESRYGNFKSDHCSAFVKRTDNDIFWTHNSWCGYLSQSMTISYCIYGYYYGKEEKDRIEFVTQNCYCAGQFGSNMDFGFNKYGICFNETTHRYSIGKPKKDGVWLCWRAAAAEMFAKSIDEFYEYLTVDNTGTYLNGYMLVDANTNETALIEMSYQRFVLFHSDGKELRVTDSTGVPVSIDDYDPELITPTYILGINYPISKKVAEDLQSADNRPMRRVQFKAQIDGVKDIQTAKDLITYVGKDTQGKEEPLSIYGRWDLGYGTTDYPKTIPDGAVDAKVFSAKKVKELLGQFQFKSNGEGGKKSFWMLYGTAKIDGKAFIWSEAKQNWQILKEDSSIDFVPNKLEGAWNETKLFMD